MRVIREEKFELTREESEALGRLYDTQKRLIPRADYVLKQAQETSLRIKRNNCAD